MVEKLFEIFRGDGFLDDDYTFYEDGSVRREYDQSMYSPYNLAENINARDISELRKKRLLEECSEDHKNKLQELLYSSKE